MIARKRYFSLEFPRDRTVITVIIKVCFSMAFIGTAVAITSSFQTLQTSSTTVDMLQAALPSSVPTVEKVSYGNTSNVSNSVLEATALNANVSLSLMQHNQSTVATNADITVPDNINIGNTTQRQTALVTKDMNWIIPVNSLNKHNEKRAQYQLGEVDNNFLRDVRVAQDQMTANYDGKSSCQRVPAKKVIKKCYGLGGTICTITRVLMRRFKMNYVLHRLDLFSCTWFRNDKTRTCEPMFGDCYFPAASKRDLTFNDTKCNSLVWFIGKYGENAFHAAIMSWMFGGLSLLPDKQEGKESAKIPIVQPPEPCIALHIRRGDACITVDRKCFDYDLYYQAVEIFVQRYPHLNRLVVLTDAHDFPLERFQILLPNISYATHYNRSRYNVNHLRNQSYNVTAPEHRNMENATSELLAELDEGSRCTALVGTFSAAVSKILFNLMLVRQGRVPLHYSLQGCGQNIWFAGWDDDIGCEEPIVRPL